MLIIGRDFHTRYQQIAMAGAPDVDFTSGSFFSLILMRRRAIQPSYFPIQPRNSTIQCFLIYFQIKPTLPLPMVAPSPRPKSQARFSSTRRSTRLSTQTQEPSNFPRHLRHVAPPIPCALTRLRILPVTTGVCPLRPLCSALRVLCVTLFPSFERSSTLTPLPLITSLQPQQFHTITHSFAQRESTISSVLNTFRTLLMSIGGGTPQASSLKRGPRCSFPCAGRKTVRRSAPQPPQLQMRPSPSPAAARVRSTPIGIRR
jgi:hypothetical protein